MKLTFKSEAIKTKGVPQQQTTLEEMLKDISEGEKYYRPGTQIYIILKVFLVLKLLKDMSSVLQRHQLSPGLRKTQANNKI